MSHNILSAIEAMVRQIAKRNMKEHEYQEFITGIRKTKIIRVGPDHITLHEYMLRHANDIADWATGYRLHDLEDKIEEKKHQAVHNIKSIFGWN